MRRSGVRWVIASVVAVVSLLLPACTATHHSYPQAAAEHPIPSPTVPYDFTQDPHYLFCLAWVNALAGEVPVLPGATEVATSPSGYLRAEYPVPMQGAPAETTRFWLAPGTLASAGEYLKSHLPAGVIYVDYAPNSGAREIPSTDISFTTKDHFGSAQLTIIRHGTGVAVSLNVNRFWVPVKPKSELIGKVVSVHVIYTDESTGKAISTINRVLTGTDAQKLANLVDSASPASDAQTGCGLILSHFGQMVFRTVAHTFTVTDAGCFSPHVSVDGYALPDITGSVGGWSDQIPGLWPTHH
jgi:hypothetical protein